MRLGVVSDTHGNTSLLESAVEYLKDEHYIDSLYHLGDNYSDVDSLSEINIVHVPGIYHPLYRSGTIPDTIQESVLGLEILLVHSLEKDFSKDDLPHLDIVLFGHTHLAEMYLTNGVFFLNPGHLKSKKDRNRDPSFGLLEIKDTSVYSAIYSMKFKVEEEIHLIRTKAGLYKD